MNPKASLVIGIFCIAFSPIFVKLAVAPPLVSAFYRIAIAWVVLAPYCLLKVKLKIGTKDLLIAMIGGIIFASDIAIWNISIIKINATISTLVANLAPIWVGLLSYLLFRKKSGLSFWIGTLVALAGMIILVGYQHLIAMQLSIGLIYAVISSVLYAFYIMVTKNVLARVNTLSFMFYNMLAAGVFLLAICAGQHADLVHFSASTWIYFGAMGLICQLVGWITINYSLNYLESTKVSVSLLGQTVLTGLLSMFLLHEVLHMNEFAGSVVVLASIAITFLKKKKAAV